MASAHRRTPGRGRTAKPCRAVVVLVVGVALGMGCASDFERRSGPNGRYLRHRERGYWIAEAPSSGEAADAPIWRRADVPETDLAYRNDEGAAISLSSRCRRTRASVAALARQLTIGTSRDALLAAGPIEHRGDSGWTQTFDTSEGGAVLRVKAVTLLAGVCVYDWLLVAPGPIAFARAEPAFDGWMSTFVSPADAAGGIVPPAAGPEREAPAEVEDAEAEGIDVRAEGQVQ